MHMKKGICWILTLMMIFTACAAPVETEPQTQPTAESAVPETVDVPVEGDGEMSPPAEVIENPADNPVIYFSMTLAENPDDLCYLVAYEEQGQTYVEYLNRERKLGYFGGEFLHRLTEQVELAEVSQLNGLNEYVSGEAQASVYISYQDGTFISADASGSIPEELRQAYRQLDAWFADQTASMDPYVPAPVISGDIDAVLRDEMVEILNQSGIRELDLLAVSDIPLDDYFVFTAGLSSDEGILRGAQCSAMMMTTPYSFTVVRLQRGADAAVVAADFRESLDWHKWVCVMPTDALIARKGDMVLCLMGMDVMYELTAQSVRNCGWEILETLQNHEA